MFYMLNDPRCGNWKFVYISVACLVVGLPIAATFYIRYQIGYYALPGVIITFIVACACVACFLLCQRRPIVPKFTTLALAVLALIRMIGFIGYYWLHFFEIPR